MQHPDPAVAVHDLDERSELDRPIAYRPAPIAFGVPLCREVLDALDTIDTALAIARSTHPGLSVGDLVAGLRAEQAKAVGA
jgi:hypothetical protein